MPRGSRSSTIRRVLSALVVTALLACAPRAFCRSDEGVVADPVSLARLREILRTSLDQGPTSSDWPIIVQLHTDMCGAYESLTHDSDGRLWQRTHELYDALRFLKSDPNSQRIREFFALHQRMADATTAIDDAMFDEISTVIGSRALDDDARERGRVGMARARQTRAIDRVLQSMPLDECTGVRGSLRSVVAHVEVPAESRAQVESILDERDRALSAAVRDLWHDYKELGLAAARAFEQVFGGIIPPIGALFSDDEVGRLRAEMKARTLLAGNRFLAARVRVREVDDSARDAICALLPPLEGVEVRLRLVAAVIGEGEASLMLDTEANCRAAARAFGTGDPDHEGVSAIVAQWWESLAAKIDETTRAKDAGDDARLWSKELFWSLDEAGSESSVFAASQETARRLSALIASRVTAAGGSLGDLRTSLSESKPRLIGSGGFQEFQRASASSYHPRRASGASLATFSSILNPSRPGRVRGRGGVAANMSRDAFDGVFRASCADSERPSFAACCDEAWAIHERVCGVEVEGRIREVDALADARSIVRIVSSQDQEARDAMNGSIRLRDLAFLAGERADEQAFETALACAGDDAALREAITIARFERFIMRERESQFVDRSGEMYEPLPNWCEVVESAPLSVAARARVRAAMCSGIASYARACIGRRTAEFAYQALVTADRLDRLRVSGLHAAFQQVREAQVRVDRATADLAQLLVNASGDEAREIDHAMLREIEPEAFAEDVVAVGMIAQARRACVTDEERASVESAWTRFDASRVAFCVELARTNLAHSQLVMRKVITPARLGAIQSDGTRGNTNARRLVASIVRQRLDVRMALEIELESLLGCERFKQFEPRDATDQILSATPIASRAP